MWRKLYEIVQDLFDLRRLVKGHEKRLDDFALFAREMTAEFNKLSDRVLRVELQLQHLKEQQATERENFRLQLENLILRSQHSLPPDEKPASRDEEEKP